MAEAVPDPGWSVRTGPAGATVTLTGDWIAGAPNRAGTNAATMILDKAGKQPLVFNTADLGRWDSALLLLLSDLREGALTQGKTFDGVGLPSAAAGLLALIGTAPPVPPAADRVPVVERIGGFVIGLGPNIRSIFVIAGDTVLRSWAVINGRARMRGTDLLTCVYEAGLKALPIVTVVNLLVGGILAFVGAVQLRKFGADIYIAALVGVAMVREMAALMTAIVMAGRTGGAYAAQIATMAGNEEIDALRTIGIPVYDYLVLPRVLALTFMMPVLYLYGCAIGIFGGFVVAVTMLNLSPASFLAETRSSAGGDQVVFGLVKSVTFGVLIALAGCRCGLNAGRGAADVGLAATSAVVIGIVGVIALDAIFAVCAHALDF